MKKNIIITMENDKLSALKMYTEQKGTTVEEELTRFTEQMYAKTVPQNVRDFIDMMSKQQPAVKPRNASADSENNA
ncbi:MAG: hypothetical protein IJ784_08990 [Ruminiclostridium sp.]|nr:hypothetical protein [Ruminiclostridium sp.]